MRRRLYTGATAAAVVVILTLAPLGRAQQQVVDQAFTPKVSRPAYPERGPTVAIDEAHDNFHTASGQYKPFAELLRADGYTVVASAKIFAAASLHAVAVLVIANARNLTAIRAGDISKPAFTEEECDAVRDWVRGGGALLLVADHAPFGGAADSLSRKFGVAMGKGWVFDRADAGGVTTQLEFSRANGRLGAHPILRGRAPGESIRHLTAFTGQALGVPAGASALMRLSATARTAQTPADLDAEDAAVRSGAVAAIGAHSTSAAGQAQGVALAFGKGKVVVLGEAAMLSAQTLRYPDGRETKFGMNVEGNDDRQFALNVLHWLSGLLK